MGPIDFKKYRKSLLTLGLTPELSYEERVGVVLTNQINLTAVFSTLIYSIFILIIGHTKLLIAAAIAITGYVISMILNARQRFFPAKFLMQFVASTTMYLFAASLGRDSGLQWVFVPIIVGSFVAFYDEKQKWQSWTPVLVPIVYFILLEVTDYYLVFSWFELPTTPFILRLSYLLNVVIVIFLLITIFFHHYNVTRKQARNIMANESSLLQTSRLARVGFSEVNIKEGYAKWNDGLKEIMGVEDDFVVTMETFMPIVHPDSQASFREAIEEAFAQKDEFDFEYRAIRPKDGRTIYIHSLGKIFRDKEGNPEIMHAVLQDVTSEREKEAKIQEERNRAEAANRAKSRFLSNVSHEIRTPLNGLLGFAQLLRNSKLDKKQQEQLSLLTYSGETLLSLIDDLLDVTRIEQGKIEIKNSHFLLGELVDRCIAPYKLQAKEKGLDFVVRKNFDLRQALYADTLRIKQILSNIVSNAIKYTPSGEVMVEVICPPVVNPNQAISLFLEVSDTGKGIAKQEQEAVFLPFTQLDNRPSTSQKGLGLGLSIVYSLVQLMEGTIELISPYCQSDAQPGSKFVIKIPVQSGSLSPTIRLDLPQSSQLETTLKVLVAEDNEINQILIQTILEEAGFQVFIVNQGDLAVDYVSKQPVDFILMDVQMPVMDGYEAAAAIRKLNPKIPIIALSANAYEADVQKSLEVGMNAHLSKPFQIQDLYTYMEKMLPELLLQKSSSIS